MTEFLKVPRGRHIVYGARLYHDPSYEYRYVGMTSAGSVRFKAHISSARNPQSAPYNLPKSKWMRKHHFSVIFDILEEVEDVSLLPMTEVKWIHILKMRGHRLLNATDGGDGVIGYEFTPEVREKMSSAHLGVKKSEEHKLSMSKAHRGKTLSIEHKQKISISKVGNLYCLGRRQTDVAKEKLRIANLGKKASAETRAKMSANGKGNHTRWHLKRGKVEKNCTFCLTDSRQGGTLDIN